MVYEVTFYSQKDLEESIREALIARTCAQNAGIFQLEIPAYVAEHVFKHQQQEVR